MPSSPQSDNLPPIYMLGGMAFDNRCFDNLNLPYPNIRYLNWVDPLKGEKLRTYVRRMWQEQMAAEKGPVILVGYSFGGIVMQEMARLLEAEKVILLASIKGPDELPSRLKMMRAIPMYRFMDSQRIRLVHPLFGWMMGYEDKAQADLFVSMVSGYSNRYLRWAVHEIVHWEGIDQDVPIVHIHGDADQIFPHRHIAHPEIIPGGNHFMVINRPEQVREKLIQAIGMIENK